MKQGKRQYQCQQCGAVASKWAGQCADCGEWNTLQESIAPAATASPRFTSYTGEAPRIVNLAEVDAVEAAEVGREEVGRFVAEPEAGRASPAPDAPWKCCCC